jgi:hypothetical protein
MSLLVYLSHLLGLACSPLGGRWPTALPGFLTRGEFS